MSIRISYLVKDRNEMHAWDVLRDFVEECVIHQVETKDSDKTIDTVWSEVRQHVWNHEDDEEELIP